MYKNSISVVFNHKFVAFDINYIKQSRYIVSAVSVVLHLQFYHVVFVLYMYILVINIMLFFLWSYNTDRQLCALPLAKKPHALYCF